MALTKNVAGVESLTLTTNPHPVPFIDEEQQHRAAAREARGNSRFKNAPQQMRVQFPKGISPIPSSRQGAVGVITSGTTIKQAMAIENYEEHRKRRIACLLEEDDMMYEHFPQERARIIPESDARLLEVRRQSEEERARYEEEGRRRDLEIRRVAPAYNKNANE